MSLFFFLFLPILGFGFVSSPPWCPDRPPVDQEDIDAIIEDVAKDAAAEAEKVTAEESVKGATEDAAKRPAGESGKATAEEAGKGPAGDSGKAAAEEEVVDDQPSSSAASGSGKYLRVGDDLFVHLPGASSTRAPIEGEVFDDEVLAAAGSRSSMSRVLVVTVPRRSGSSRPWVPASESSRRSIAPA